ncbi:MAG: hypothetical protein A2946_01565 [Candidatus Liptonbacteria bacterium RIFCSPLOWO2_01_FULL_53_13]|uniref:Uncharacterized protein n=1 Tax=Candidatus Liptonbacteria bacterium RIFCSPLOWO2_01_FULL_53_13 TaxID=1798651 RepID=A0A1G2CMJ3_9BACT|nr:MAG: hypothetical protein A2946_01565 [Candidatus Liptonbacteria bacterium RIFCSPLOWO2_01_FULL_53_13]
MTQIYADRFGFTRPPKAGPPRAETGAEGNLYLRGMLFLLETPENTPRLGLLRRSSFGYEGRTARVSGAVTRERPVGAPCQQSCHGVAREIPRPDRGLGGDRRATNFISA